MVLVLARRTSPTSSLTLSIFSCPTLLHVRLSLTGLPNSSMVTPYTPVLRCLLTSQTPAQPPKALDINERHFKQLGVQFPPFSSTRPACYRTKCLLKLISVFVRSSTIWQSLGVASPCASPAISINCLLSVRRVLSIHLKPLPPPSSPAPGYHRKHSLQPVPISGTTSKPQSYLTTAIAAQDHCTIFFMAFSQTQAFQQLPGPICKRAAFVAKIHASRNPNSTLTLVLSESCIIPFVPSALSNALRTLLSTLGIACSSPLRLTAVPLLTSHIP